MSFTDIFIKRPVLSTVVSLLIFIVGLTSLMKLPLQEYPQMENTVITVTTSYPGASADVVQGFVTVPLEKSIGSAEGIDYMTAQSSTGMSVITANIVLNFDPNKAFTNINAKVNAVLSQLPTQIKSPVLDKQTGQTMPPALILGFTSTTLSPEQVSAYVNNVIIPKLHETNGVGDTIVWGDKSYAMRIWLDTKRMAQLNVEPADVYNALNNNNYQAAPGKLKPKYNFITLTASTDLHDVDGFKQLVVKNENGRLVRLDDISRVELSSQDVDTQVYYNGQKAVFVAINPAPGDNPLSVVDGILKAGPDMRAHFPSGLEMSTVYNSTIYIQAAIDDVIKTIIEAVVIVVIVIFLFLGALRSVMIPVVTIPLSLVGVAVLMSGLGFSINLLTLLALVLAVGLVVDDAIVVLENIYRHLEEGLTPFQAAIKGAREITGPVIVMTVTLAAVFAPIGFMGGLTGTLFKEFAFTLAASVIISGVVALTFSPMLCSKVINRQLMDAPMVKKIDLVFIKIRNFYSRCLHAVLNYRPAVVIVAVVILMSCYGLFRMTQTELAPQEDMGFIGVFGIAPSSATLDFLQQYNPKLQKIYSSFPQADDTFAVDGYPSANNLMSGIILKPWDERSETAMELTPQVMAKMSGVVGLNTVAYQLPPLPGVQAGPPVNFVITTTDSYQAILPIADQLVQRAYASGQFIYADSDLMFDSPQLNVVIDRPKAAALGINMSDIANALSVVLGGNNVNYFSAYGYSYEVIPQAERHLRSRPEDLALINIRASNGALVPLSSFISFTKNNVPATLNQFQQLNSATIQAVPMPGVTQGEALKTLEGIAAEIFPKNMNYDFGGQSRQLVQEGDALLFAFFFGLIVIFLVLAAQFESFRDPFIVLVSVPMSIFGALVPLFLGAATINIYTEIGLITLIGLISKHGILMVEFANKLQEHEKLTKREAIQKSATIRLRPILMTTLSMVFGVVPLVIATGAGAESRYCVGLVIACGMTIGTLFTLFVVPTMYTFFAQDRLKHMAHQAKTMVMPA
jgi:multidrug efflux pump